MFLDVCCGTGDIAMMLRKYSKKVEKNCMRFYLSILKNCIKA
ncbi:MAG TPA: hypothetical protein DDX37_12300 [Candidatus Omnitrophica bacterium]|nr:hypothetical protein [Candidatus Omnitrophota bacterium]